MFVPFHEPAQARSASSPGMSGPREARDLAPAEAVLNVIVYHADRLHERVQDRGAHERESPAAQVLAERVRLARGRGDVAKRGPSALNRLAAHELPDVRVERAALFLQREEGTRVLHGALH